MIERSLHSSPHLRAKIVFSENYQEGVCVCVRVCERESGGGHLSVGAKHSVMSGQSSSSTDLVIEVVKGEVTLQDQ